MSGRILLTSIGIGLILWAQAVGTTEPASPTSWPMRVSTVQGPLLIFQPQIQEYQDPQIRFWIAVSLGEPGQEKTVYGAVWVEGRVQADASARTLRLVEARIQRYRFGSLDTPRQRNLVQAIQQALNAGSVVLSLDDVVAAATAAQKQAQETQELPVVVPKILFREHPAILVPYEGTPVLTAVENTSLFRVANTPFFVVLDAESRFYYLRAGGAWFRAADALGPFEHVREVPSQVARLLETSGYRDPEQALTDLQAATTEIVTATEPAELICTDGPAKLAVIPGTDLLYVVNTDADVFLSIKTRKLYVVASGRWYEAAQQDGPWAYVPADQLPEDFRRIPPDSPKADVLAHVPQTPVAQEAVEQAQVPQIKAVDRRRISPPKVVYDGAPEFERIDGLPISYAVNTFSTVLKIDGQYYLCEDGVWWVGPSASGPWKLCERVPVEVYLIPPTCPVYPVRFVYILGSTPERIYVGWTAGYWGCYVWRGTVVYGTGYHYRPWHGRWVILRPATFGIGARYSIRSCDWGFTFGMVFGRPVLWEVWYWDPGWYGWFGFGGYRPVIVREYVRWVDRPRHRHWRDWDRDRPDWHRDPDWRPPDRDRDRDHDRPDREPQEPQPVVQRSLIIQGTPAIDLDQKFQEIWERTRPRQPQPDPRLIQPESTPEGRTIIQERQRQEIQIRGLGRPPASRPQPDPRVIESRPGEEQPTTPPEEKQPLSVADDRRWQVRTIQVNRLEILRTAPATRDSQKWDLLQQGAERNLVWGRVESGGFSRTRQDRWQAGGLSVNSEKLWIRTDPRGWQYGWDSSGLNGLPEVQAQPPPLVPSFSPWWRFYQERDRR